MFSFGKRSVVFVLVLFIIIAVVGWAWRQRDSLPFITKPLMTIMSPFEYGASSIMNVLASNIHIVDVSLKNRIEWESLEKENADLKSRTVDYDEVVAENDRLRRSSTLNRAITSINCWPVPSFPVITVLGPIP